MEPCQLYLITPPHIPDLPAFVAQLEAVLEAVPVAALQLRLKAEEGRGEAIAESSVAVHAAETIFPVAKARGTVCLVNDSAKVAREVGADGVHLGQGDGSVEAARELLGDDALVGVTCHNSRDLAFQAAADGADYVAFGAFFPTPTKAPKSAADLELLEWWHEAMTLPCVAIGGITPLNAKALVEAGADFLAVSSGVWGAASPERAARSLWELCQR